MVGKTPQNHRDSPEIPSPQPLKKRKQKIRIAITPEVFNLETWCGYHRNQLIEPSSIDTIIRMISPFLAIRQSKMAAKFKNCNCNTWSIQLSNMIWLSLESAEQAASVDATFRMISPFLAILLRKTVKLHFLDPKINDFRKILTKVLNLDTWYCYH